MYGTILVPLDGSEFGEQALPTALSIARASGASLHIAHVHDAWNGQEYDGLTPYMFEGFDAREYDRETRKHEEAYLDGIAQLLNDADGIELRSEVLDGQVVQALESYAKRIDADLVVMTTHGRTGFSRAWLGSVADALVRHSTRPTFLIRPGGGSAEPGDASFRHILLPLDGSRCAEGIVEPALDLARVTGARFTLIRVISPNLTFGARSYPLSRGDVTALREEAEGYLDDVAGDLRRRDVDVRTRVVEHAAPARAIMEAAREGDADLIAMATHGRGGVGRLVMGSVADKILRGLEKPMLLKHPAEVAGSAARAAAGAA